MSVSGLKKQFHKASQLLNEKINGAEGTRLDEDFIKMERKINVTHKLVLELVPKTTEYLQPNPAYRARVGMLNTVSRLRGKVKSVSYPQTEGILGDCMLRYGRELGTDSTFGCVLVDFGEALKHIGHARDMLDIRVKTSFTDPLQCLQDSELKEIGYHLRKLEGRRLDFDYKKRRKGKLAALEIRKAHEKFEESRELAERSMHCFLENDVEQVHHLSALVEAMLDYHQQSCQILSDLRSTLQSRISSASSRPKREYTPKPVTNTMCYMEPNGFSNSLSFQSSGGCNSILDQPCCQALYSFNPENARELGFKEGDLITLTNQIDENWYEGMINGQSGFFPISYVQVLVPLPQ
ncbi:endophilin-A3b [Chanos chanos]|uniref:Endophilin-A3b n=1 Tax=Chanos chanos TaxID=29144 RepID=A0A6J2UQW1_CHACN|nr:endophilin-A3-like [Chanos chanos]